MIKPKKVYRVIRNGIEILEVRCPECGLLASVDSDQYKGKVSMDCVECDYHETHDLRDIPIIPKRMNGSY